MYVNAARRLEQKYGESSYELMGGELAPLFASEPRFGLLLSLDNSAHCQTAFSVSGMPARVHVSGVFGPTDLVITPV
jgi:hypothetical protein